jgi:hypothetical protein
MGHRNFVMHLVIPSGLWSLFGAAIIAGGLTLLAFLTVKLVVGPLLRSWLTPTIDSTAMLFHLAPGEVSLVSIPARRLWGWTWQPGALVVTDRRIWFLPSAWNLEPWSASKSEIVGCEAQLPALAGLLPIRNWPELLRLGTRDGCHSTFAMADPALLLAHFEPSARDDAVTFSYRKMRLGVFDV